MGESDLKVGGGSVGAGRRGHALPEEGVVPVTTAIVADDRGKLLRHLVRANRLVEVHCTGPCEVSRVLDVVLSKR